MVYFKVIIILYNILITPVRAYQYEFNELIQSTSKKVFNQKLNEYNKNEILIKSCMIQLDLHLTPIDCYRLYLDQDLYSKHSFFTLDEVERICQSSMLHINDLRILKLWEKSKVIGKKFICYKDLKKQIKILIYKNK